MKKFVSMLMALVMSLGLLSSVTVYAQSYPDVDEGHWAYVWVEYMNSHGYIHGYPDGNYRPGQEITRAEFVTILNYIFNSTGTTNKNYIDVKEGDWYYDHIHAAVDAGYLHGYDDATDEHDGTMKPNNRITREEAAVVIACAYGLELSDDVSKFSDSEEICFWAVPYVGALAKIGAISGDAETASYRPHDYMLRAEVASIIAQTDKVINGESKKVQLPAELVVDDKTHTVKDITTDGLSEDAKIALSLSYVETDDVGKYLVTAYLNGEPIIKDVLINEFVAFLKNRTFTPEEIEQLSVDFHGFKDAKDGSALLVTLTASDLDTKEVYDTKDYMIAFGEASIHWPEKLKETAKDSYTLTGITTNYQGEAVLGVTEFKKEEIEKYTLTVKIGDEVIAEGVTLDELNKILKDKNLTAKDVDTMTVVIDVEKYKNGAELSLNFKFTNTDTKKVVGTSKTYTISYKSGGAGGDAPTPVSPVSPSRDRVVESLSDYQNGLVNSSSSKQIANDYANHGISSDMLKVILTNDGMVTFNSSVSQTLESAEVEAELALLKSGVLGDVVGTESCFDHMYLVYEDVVRHVLADTNLNYDTATITTASKDKYVLLFRAMVATINGAADAAITVYNDPANAAMNETQKFTLFKNTAINNATSVLNTILDSSTVSFEAGEKANIILSATAYVDDLFNSNISNNSFKQDLTNITPGSLTLGEFANIVKRYM